MSSIPSVDSALDSMPLLDCDFLDGEVEVDGLDSTTLVTDTSPIVELNGDIDPRIKLLSHSSRGTLNKCARKFQLYRLSSLEAEQADAEKDAFQQLTFDYGTGVGMGIQAILNDESIDDAILAIFLMWGVDPLLRNNKQSKSLWECILAVQQFKSIVDNGYLNEYELVEYEGKPAVELSFRVNLPNGFAYRGYIDAVLRHKVTGAVVVLEDKTSSYRNINPAQYKNSGQALGYSVILDHIFKDLSSYTVLYLVYSTPLKEFIELPFEKSRMQRALWLNELLIDVKKIELYHAFNVYPMNGDFCYDFYRECEYLGLCTLNTSNLIKPLTEKILEDMDKREVYDFDIDFKDLIDTQIDK